MRTCLLCDGPADSKEHYIPKWLSEVTGRGKGPLIVGTASGGEMRSQASRGCALSATHRNLCTKCNSDLGAGLEGGTKVLLEQFVRPSPVAEWSAHLNTWLPAERERLASWALLRALQMNEQFVPKRFTPEMVALIKPHIIAARDSEASKLQRGFFVEIAEAWESDWGFTISQQFFDRYRDSTVSNPHSFIWAMQANHCLLVAGYAPDAQLMKDSGWGYGMVPFDLQKCPRYRNMADMLSRSHIDSRAPALYLPVNYKRARSEFIEKIGQSLPSHDYGTASGIADDWAAINRKLQKDDIVQRTAYRP